MKAAKTTQSQTPKNDIQQSLKVRIDDCTSALECVNDAIIIIAGLEDTNNNLRGKILYHRSKALVVALWGSGRKNGSGPSDDTTGSRSDTGTPRAALALHNEARISKTTFYETTSRGEGTNT